MSDLLTRLARRALGTAPPALHPRLPARFAGTPGDADSPLPREEWAETEAAPALASPRGAAAPAPAAHRAEAPVLRRPSSTGPVARTDPAAATHPRQPAAEQAPARPVLASPPVDGVLERFADGDDPHPSTLPAAAAHASPPPTEVSSADVDAGAHRPSSPPRSAPPARTWPERGDDGSHPLEQLVEAEAGEGLLMPRASSGPSRPPPAAGEDAAVATEGRRPSTGRAAAPPPPPRIAGEPGEPGRVVSRGDGGPVLRAEGETAAADGGRGVETPGTRAARPDAVRVAERPARPAAGERGGERPVVRVTIGRIEVRAAEPAPRPAARAGWTPPVLSLDQYLKRESKR